MHGAGVCSGGEFGGSQDEKKKRKRPPPPAGGSMSKGPKKSCSFSSSSPRKKNFSNILKDRAQKNGTTGVFHWFLVNPLTINHHFCTFSNKLGVWKVATNGKIIFFFWNLIKWPRESIVGDPCNLGLLKNVNVLNNVCQLCRVNNGHLGPTMALLAFFGV